MLISLTLQFGLKTPIEQISAGFLTPSIKFQSAADVLSSICVTRLATYILKRCDISCIYYNVSIEFHRNLVYSIGR